jgi:hypothetical protein
MKKILALIAILGITTAPAFAASDKPLVIEGGVTKQLPANTTLQLNATSTGAASINMGQGTAPSSPNNGDCWITTAGLYCRYNGGTVGPFGTGTGSGTVTTSGSPASGNLTTFSGASTITNGDLSGDCTTSGTLSITCTKTGGTSFGAAATLGVGAGLASSGGNIVNNSAAVTGAVRSNGSGTMTQAACADLSNGAASCSTDATNASNIGSGTLADARLNADVVITGNNNTFTKSQRGTPVSISISTSTFTPNFDTAQNFEITLIHASCPCTLANPSTTLVPGQSGYIKVIQSATGSDAITTWGSSYYFPGGTSTITFSTGASQYDMFSYVVDLASHINLTPPAQNFSH